MSDIPPMLKRGERARLFPVLADTSRENRLASIFLSILPIVPALAEEVLASIGVRVGKRTQIEVFTEVVLKENSDTGCRPDGLIVVTSGKNVWTAIIEAKIGKAEIDADQVTRYLDCAKANKIDAVITISNQFVARADLSPVNLPKLVLRKAGLFHWSWTWLTTQCEIIAHRRMIDDPVQSFVLSELLRLLRHPGTGVERFTQMASSWKDVVQAVSNRERLKRNGAEVEETVAAWFSELRDLSLQLSRLVGQAVSTRIERKHLAEPQERAKAAIVTLTEENLLRGAFAVPDSASDIELTADLARKTIIVGMRVKAPQDRKSTKARVNWLIRMLKNDDPRLIVRAHWPGRKPPTQRELSALRENPEAIDGDASDTAPHSFEVLLVEAGAKRFSGRRTFIEDVERVVPEFYELVGQNLRAWQAAPPKPLRPSSATEELLQIDEGLETAPAGED